MKKSLFFKSLLSLVAVMGLSMFQSCSESGGTDDSGKEEEETVATLAISTESLSFDADGNATDDAAGKVTITTDGIWGVEIDESKALTTWGWKLSNKAGSGNGSFTLTVAPTEEAREAIITVSSSKVAGGEAVTKTITVKQAGPAAATDKTVTAAELVAEMKDSALPTDFGSKYNYVLDVVVSKVIAGVAYVQDAATGIALVGEGAADYASGDKLKVTVPALEGKGNLVKGAGQLDLATLTIVKGDNEAVAPIVATAADVVANKYVNMYVKIEKVASSVKGVWTTGEADGEHTFTAAGTEFKAIVPKSAEEMIGAGYAVVAEGSMAGIAGTAAAKGSLVIVNAADVVDFKFSAPEAQAIDPAVYKFPVEGGSKEFTVTGVNLKGQEITIEGLSSQYSYTVDNTVENPVITITAKENTTGAELAEEAVKVVVKGGNSVDLAVSQDDGYMSVGEAYVFLKERAGTDPVADFQEQDIIVKGIVSSDPQTRCLNMGQFSIMTEGATEPHNGLMVNVADNNFAAVDAFDLHMGDEVIITFKKGCTIANKNYPMITASAALGLIDVKKTGHTAEVTPIKVTREQYWSYALMPVSIDLTVTAAGTLADSAVGKSLWLFASIGTYPNLAFRVGGFSQADGNPLIGFNYKSGEVTVSGIVIAYAETASPHIYPRNLDDVKGMAAEE